MAAKSTISNIIDFPQRKRSKKESGKVPASNKATPVIDMTKRRDQIIDQERRLVKRTVLSHFIGVFVVLPKQGLQPVGIYDISEGGLAFDLPAEQGQFNIGETITMRIYLSHDTYFSYSVKVANVRAVEHESILRHGVILRKDDASYQTLTHFMRFLENVSRIAKKDNGDRTLGRVD